jgi:hypothetical protein
VFKILGTPHTHPVIVLVPLDLYVQIEFLLCFRLSKLKHYVYFRGKMLSNT